MRLLGAAVLATAFMGRYTNANDVLVSGDTCATGLPKIGFTIRADPAFTLNGVYEYQGETPDTPWGRTPGASPYYRRQTGSAVYPVVYLYRGPATGYEPGPGTWFIALSKCLQHDYPSWSPNPPLETHPDGCKILSGCVEDRDKVCSTSLSAPPRSHGWWQYCRNFGNVLGSDVTLAIQRYVGADYDDQWDDDDDDDDDGDDDDATSTSTTATSPLPTKETDKDDNTAADDDDGDDDDGFNDDYFDATTTAIATSKTVTTTTTIASADTITTSTITKSTSTATITTTSATTAQSVNTPAASAPTTTSSERNPILSSTATTTTASARLSESDGDDFFADDDTADSTATTSETAQATTTLAHAAESYGDDFFADDDTADSTAATIETADATTTPAHLLENDGDDSIDDDDGDDNIAGTTESTTADAAATTSTLQSTSSTPLNFDIGTDMINKLSSNTTRSLHHTTIALGVGIPIAVLAVCALLFWCKERQNRRKLQFNPPPQALQNVHRIPNVMYAPAGGGGAAEHPDHVYDAGNRNRGKGYGGGTGAGRSANGHGGGGDQIVYTSDSLATYAIPLDVEHAAAPVYSVPKSKGIGRLPHAKELAKDGNRLPLGSNSAYEGYSVWEAPAGTEQAAARTTGNNHVHGRTAANTVYETPGSSNGRPLGSNKAYEGYSVWESPAGTNQTGARISSDSTVHGGALGNAVHETTGSKIVYAVPLEDDQVVGGVAGSSVVYATPIEDNDGTTRGRYLSIASGSISGSIEAIAGRAPQDTLPMLNPGRRMTKRSPAPPQNVWQSGGSKKSAAIGKRRVTLRAGDGEDAAAQAEAATKSVYDAGGGRRGNTSNA